MIDLNYFSKSEFREWYSDMSPKLLTMLDVLRHVLESPIHISSHPDSLGRELGNSQSAHNVELWGEVQAVDCFIDRAQKRDDVQSVVEVAEMLGFTGIGIYPYTRNNKGQKQCGFHLDVRPTKAMGDPATWGRLENGEYVSLQEALKHVK